MTQQSIKKGLKLFGEAGTDAIMKESHQLHDGGVLEPMTATQLAVPGTAQGRIVAVSHVS